MLNEATQTHIETVGRSILRHLSAFRQLASDYAKTAEDQEARDHLAEVDQAITQAQRQLLAGIKRSPATPSGLAEQAENKTP